MTQPLTVHCITRGIFSTHSELVFFFCRTTHFKKPYHLRYPVADPIRTIRNFCQILTWFQIRTGMVPFLIPKIYKICLKTSTHVLIFIKTCYDEKISCWKLLNFSLFVCWTDSSFLFGSGLLLNPFRNPPFSVCCERLTSWGRTV